MTMTTTTPVVTTTIRAQPRNWPLYIFVVFIPLQSVYLEQLPNFGGGLNFINVMFLLSWITAVNCRGGLVRGSGVNGWVMAYMIGSLIALVVGYGVVDDPSGHINFLKDQLIAVAFIFLAQMSVRDWAGLRRLFLASLIPLPYIFLVLIEQNAEVRTLHYTHDLRVNATFVELGANEMAAFFVTAALVSIGLLVGWRCGWGWRIVLASVAGLAATSVVLSYSRTAYIAVLVGVVLILLLTRARLRWLIPAMILAAAMPLILPPAAVERFETISVEEGERDESTESRFEFWEVAIEQFSGRPLLGTGFHTFHHAEINPLEMDTHNYFLRELVEKGLLGAVIFLGLLWSVTRLLWRGFRMAEPGSWYAGLMLGMCGAFLALLIGNLFGDRFSHYPMIAHFWLYIGLVLRGLSLRYAELAGGTASAR